MSGGKAMTTEQLKAKIKELLPDNEELRYFEANRLRDVDDRYIPAYHFSHIDSHTQTASVFVISICAWISR